MTAPQQIRHLLDRLARLAAAEEWSDDLNPAQRAALDYLARANRFSRAPSVVASYLSATRGTVSQTLKALLRKELIKQTSVPGDKRSITYEVTAKGRRLVNATNSLDTALAALPAKEQKALQLSLEKTVRHTLKARGGHSFGMCRTCRYHKQQGAGAFCTLLHEPLLSAQRDEICHEHVA